MDREWIEHRRGLDRELLGWMQPRNDGFVVIDRLGRERTAVVDWHTAEETLDELGIGYLADPYELQLEGGEWLRVRIIEVSSIGITVKKDDWGDLNAPQLFYSVRFPMPRTLRPAVG